MGFLQQGPQNHPRVWYVLAIFQRKYTYTVHACVYRYIYIHTYICLYCSCVRIMLHNYMRMYVYIYIINFQEQCSNGYLFQVRFGQNYRYGEQGTHGTGHGCVGAAHGYVSMVLGTIPMYRTHRTHHTYPVSDRSSNRFLKIKHVFLKFLFIITFKRYIKKIGC